MEVRGILHLHSSFSHDCKIPLLEVGSLAKANGFHFLLMTEHNNYMNGERTRDFVEECYRLSSPDFLYIPGLELSCFENAVHILAVGLERFIGTVNTSKTFERVIEEVHEAGGLAILAHPSWRGGVYRLSEKQIQLLDGAEIWNIKNDNRLCPSRTGMRIFRGMKQQHKPLLAFAGLDLHYPDRFVGVGLHMNVQRLSSTAVLTGLKEGDYYVKRGFVKINSDGKLTFYQRLIFSFFSFIMRKSKAVGLAMREGLQAVGLPLPESVIKWVKRFF